MSTTQAQNLLALFACTEPAPARRSFQAGALKGELVGGRFGPLRVNGHEVWHGLGYLLRDVGWGTPEPVFDRIQEHPQEWGTLLVLQGCISCGPDDISDSPGPGSHLNLKITLGLYASGELQLRAEAQPSVDLKVNRCGWVLMHPMNCAGQALEVVHADGRTSRSSWPFQVPPWPLFTGVREVRHEYAPGFWAAAYFGGEDYEIEDQRNNADASFKTYSRSNMMPRPYVLRQGQHMVRELRLCLLGDPAPPISPKALPSPCLPSETVNPTRLGMAITADMTLLPQTGLLSMLQAWRPSFLHLSLWPGQAAPDWTSLSALQKAGQCGLRLDFVVPDELGQGGPGDQQCLALAQELEQVGIAPEMVAAQPCGPNGARLLRQCFPEAAIGGGTPHFFAQLNRLELSGGEDFMSFTVCPTVHGAGDAHVMHGLRSLPSMLQTARTRHPGRVWHLGPSSLAARASPLGPLPPCSGKERKALAGIDPRTPGLFGAAWLLGHLASALRASVQALSVPALASQDVIGEINPQGRLSSPAAAWLGVCFSWTSLQCLNWSSPTDLYFGDEVFPAWPLAAIAGKGPGGWQVLLANLGDKPCVLTWSYGGTYSLLDAQSWQNYQETMAHNPWPAMRRMPTELVVGPYALLLINLFFEPGNSDHAS